MGTGLANADKAKVRERHAAGEVGREALLAAESAAYHGAGTCTFYGTANSNQMLLEAMGLHVPGAAFAHPHGELRSALTREAVATVLRVMSRGTQRRASSEPTPQPAFRPIGRLVDERVIVNAMAALLATGGSTNHLIHWVAVARAAGIAIDWSDFAELSAVVPLLARVYPNGEADVNQFQACGGPGYVIGELLAGGLMHADVATVGEGGLASYGQVPALAEGQRLRWSVPDAAAADPAIVRPVAQAFTPTGGLKLLTGNLGRAVIKTSAVPDSRHIVEAPARVFTSQEALLAAFNAGELERDVVVVVRFQGPRANGMPELHKLTPPLAVLQGRGFRVALVTDGRMSGASGKVPAAIHVSPEALAGGPLAKLRDGDVVRVDAVAGTLSAVVEEAAWSRRENAERPADEAEAHEHDLGRELFAGFRRHVSSAEEGAISWL
jgi:phosphogluconate dehydratase